LEKVDFGGAYKQHIKCMCLHIKVLVQQLSKSCAVNAIQKVCCIAAQDTRYFYAEIRFIKPVPPLKMKCAEKNLSLLLLVDHFLGERNSL